MRPELSQAVRLLRANTPEAVDEALALLQNTVFSFSMKLCGHREDAEDTMQEVLYRSLRHLARIDEPRALAVWLYTVTRNRCWRMRKTHAHAPRQTLSLDELIPGEADLARLLEDPASGPEDNLLAGERSEQLHHAILRIPPQLRIVLILHDMEDLPTEDVARILNLKPGTVRVRLHRARLAVRRELSRPTEAAPPALPLRPRKKSRRVPIACRELFANLSEYLDERVEPRTCDEIRRHMEGCPSCIAFLRDLRGAIDRCRAMNTACDPALARRLRSILTREYLRLVEKPLHANKSVPRM
jgi:RNA polymerase sigma-70 factor, ECF subfamily